MVNKKQKGGRGGKKGGKKKGGKGGEIARREARGRSKKGQARVAGAQTYLKARIMGNKKKEGRKRRREGGARTCAP